MSQKPDQTYYEILEVAPDAPQHEIQRAFQRAKETYSPDSPALYTMFTEQEARDLLNLIDEAYNVLSNQAKREIYDQQLASQKRNAKAAGGSQPLPDFEYSEEPATPARTKESAPSSAKPSSARDTKETSADASLPNGYARTRFSVYEVNSAFEEEIRNQTVFDGAFLQKIREYKKISIDQLSNETRISRTYLIAVEANDYESLPAAVFVRGFVVQVARVLGLREQQVASSYMEGFKKGRKE